MKRRDVLSLVLHLLLFALTVLGCIMRFTGFRLIGGSGTPSGYAAFRYFTVLSNVFAGAIALVGIVFDALRLGQKITARPLWFQVVEYVSASCLALTMVTVMLILAPGSAILNQDFYYFIELYFHHNLFFHLVSPFLAIALYLVQVEVRPHYRWIVYAFLPALAYEAFYCIVVISHMDGEGKVAFQYDWYGFFQGGPWIGALAVLGMIALTLLLAFLLVLFGQKVHARLRQNP